MPSLPLKWLYVDFNSYFASVEQQLQPDLRGKPVVVVPVETDSTCAIAASYEAKALGIKTGTPIWEAKQKCPDLVCVLARHELYVEYHHRAIAEINRHIPVTAVCSIDEMVAELLRNEAHPDVARNIALSIKAGLAENLGPWLRCSIGIASNRYLAKVAGELQKPDGLTTLFPEEIQERLSMLKLTDLPGISRNMEKRLHRAGIYEVADIWPLDRKSLRQAWGSIWGERMWYLLRGFDIPELPAGERRTIGHSHVLGPQMRPVTPALDVARRMTQKACSRLRRMEYHAGVIGFSVRLENGQRIGAEYKCLLANDSPGFLALLYQFWDRYIPRHKGILIKKFSVALSRLTPDAEVMPDLFAPPPTACAHSGDDLARRTRLSFALDHINSRFGRDSALIGMLPSTGRGFSGTKIAFTRIPDREEFFE